MPGPAAAGIHLGTVTRVDAAGAYVELPELAPRFEYGPARYPKGAAPAAGDEVAVAFRTGATEEPVVVAVLE